jgi:DNA invertase Pin-like site-specific DNA recombinase
MYRNMNDWTEIRRRVLAGGVSRRQILRETGMHRKTLKKILEHVSGRAVLGIAGSTLKSSLDQTHIGTVLADEKMKANWRHG